MFIYDHLTYLDDIRAYLDDATMDHNLAVDAVIGSLTDSFIERMNSGEFSDLDSEVAMLDSICETIYRTNYISTIKDN